MNYHQVFTDDMRNGEGLRVVLFVSGCNHHCLECHNPQTWDLKSGQPFTAETKAEIFRELEKDYIDGITFSGGDPLHPSNVEFINNLITEIRSKFPTKTIWIYTGYSFEYITNPNYILQGNVDLETFCHRFLSVCLCDVLVDGMFIKELSDVNYPWAGSTNQRVIDVQRSIQMGKVILLD